MGGAAFVAAEAAGEGRGDEGDEDEPAKKKRRGRRVTV